MIIGIARLYYAGQLVMYMHCRQNETIRFSGIPPEIYDGGYIKYPPGHKFFPTQWSRCDSTPVLLEDVPKELLVLELLNPPQEIT